jgi:hypothetical protein
MRDEVAVSLKALTALRVQFEIRADLLPADLALAGLIDDLLSASQAAVDLVEHSTRTAYPLVRTAFEAAQRIVVLATDDNYLSTGTRAWLYYQRKDADVHRKMDPGGAANWLRAVVAQMRTIWTPYNSEADELLACADSSLKETRGKNGRLPDNFMQLDLADVVQERYAKIWPKKMPGEVKQMNRGIYSLLSRDSHARLRLEPAALTVGVDGVVRVIPRRVDERPRQRTLLRCLELCHYEAIGALSYLFAHRSPSSSRQHPPGSLSLGSALRHEFLPDLGLHVAGGVDRETVLRFTAVPIQRLGVLPDGTVSWSANRNIAGREYAATFDAPNALRTEMAEAIDIPEERLSPETRHEIGGRLVDVECKLGAMQRSENDAFVPFIVCKITTADPPHGG